MLFSLHFSVITVPAWWCHWTCSSCQTSKQTGMSCPTATTNNRRDEINTVPQWPYLKGQKYLRHVKEEWFHVKNAAFHWFEFGAGSWTNFQTFYIFIILHQVSSLFISHMLIYHSSMSLNFFLFSLLFCVLSCLSILSLFLFSFPHMTAPPSTWLCWTFLSVEWEYFLCTITKLLFIGRGLIFQVSLRIL